MHCFSKLIANSKPEIIYLSLTVSMETYLIANGGGSFSLARIHSRFGDRVFSLRGYLPSALRMFSSMFGLAM